ncbi:DUF669 domain-containing protein, partial [Escherichia sp. TWPC-MK]
MDYEIRSDVDQPCQGQKILYDNFDAACNLHIEFSVTTKL